MTARRTALWAPSKDASPRLLSHAGHTLLLMANLPPVGWADVATKADLADR